MGSAANIRRDRSLIGVIALIGIMAGLWLSQRPANAQTTVHVFLTDDGKLTLLNFQQPGLRLGDRLAGHAPLLDAGRTDRVGRAFQECVVMSKITDYPDEGPKGLYWCTYDLQLADGDLTLKGLDPHGPGVYTLAVLGGTGTYSGAVGEAILTDDADGTDIAINLAG